MRPAESDAVGCSVERRGGGATNVNPNANYSETYTWNDANGNHKYDIGEQTGTPVIPSGTTTTTNILNDTSNSSRLVLAGGALFANTSLTIPNQVVLNGTAIVSGGIRPSW